MAKYKKLTEPVYIEKTEVINSQYGGEVHDVTMVGIKTKNKYYTYADPKNINFRHWQHILDLAERRGVVLTNLKFKDEQKNLINADSDVKIEYAVCKEELNAILQDYWRQQDQFSKWFGEDIK